MEVCLITVDGPQVATLHGSIVPDPMTVQSLRACLGALGSDLPVYVAFCDSEYNWQGGEFSDDYGYPERTAGRLLGELEGLPGNLPVAIRLRDLTSAIGDVDVNDPPETCVQLTTFADIGELRLAGAVASLRRSLELPEAWHDARVVAFAAARLASNDLSECLAQRALAEMHYWNSRVREADPRSQAARARARTHGVEVDTRRLAFMDHARVRLIELADENGQPLAEVTRMFDVHFSTKDLEEAR